MKTAFDENGYCIVNNVITSDQCSVLRKCMIKRIISVIFRDTMIKPTSDYKDIKLLVDPAARKSISAENAPWTNYLGVSDSRKPIYDRNTGRGNIIYGNDKMEMIDGNLKLYNIITEIYERNDVVFTEGPGKYTIRVPYKGSKSLSPRLERTSCNDGHRLKKIKGIVIVGIDGKVDLESCGLPLIIPRFHIYYGIIRTFMERMGYSKDSILLNCKKIKFNQTLEILNVYLDHYTQLYNQIVRMQESKYSEILEDVMEVFIYIYKKPWGAVPEKFIDLKWSVLCAQPGDVIFMDDRLPYYYPSMTISSCKPLIACDYNVGIGKGLYGGMEISGSINPEEITWMVKNGEVVNKPNNVQEKLYGIEI